MYRSILVPLDGSRMAEWALPVAISIARRQSAQLELITIEQVTRVPAGLTFSDGGESWRSAAQDPPLGYLSEVVRRIAEVYPVPVKPTVRAGVESVAYQVVQHAYDSDTDLIVIATHGYGLLKRFWLGSVANAVVRRSRIATLLVRPDAEADVDLTAETQFRNILIPLDGSPAAQTMVDHAIAVGGTDARYTLLQALPLMPVFSSEYVVVAAEIDGEMGRSQQEGARAMLDTTADQLRLRDRRFQVQTAVAAGASVAGEILDYAERNHIDLIGLTTHGHGGWVRMMLGSVADKVTRGAEVPVLLYRPLREVVRPFRRARKDLDLLLERIAALEERGHELEGLVDAKSSLIRGLSHDIRNPLATVISYAELLEEGTRGELNAAQHEYISRMERATGSALAILDDLLTLSQAEAGTLSIEPAEVDLIPLLQDTIDDYASRAEQAGLELRSGLPTGLASITTDGARVKQILSNLLSNAIKFTPPPGQVILSAAVRSGPGTPGPGRWQALEVRDTGPGIPLDQRESVFKEFYRINDRAHARQGFGLGLAMSRRIARLLGGDVTIANDTVRGATFTCYLPLSDLPALVTSA